MRLRFFAAAAFSAAALFDFGLTPRHLRNSAETIMKYEKDNPQTAPLLQAFAKALLAPNPKPAAGQPIPLSYYKSNMIDRLGTLRCRFAEPVGKLRLSRWPVREPLLKYLAQS